MYITNELTFEYMYIEVFTTIKRESKIRNIIIYLFNFISTPIKIKYNNCIFQDYYVLSIVDDWRTIPPSKLLDDLINVVM